MNLQNLFLAIARISIAKPKTVLAICTVIFLALMTQISQLQMQSSAESYLQDDTPAIIDFKAFRQDFGRDEVFILIITGQTVFDLEFLSNLKALHQELEQKVTLLQSVESLANVRSIYADGDELVNEDLLEFMPSNQQELAQIRERIQGKDIYYGRLINEEEDTAALFIKLQPYYPKTHKDGSVSYEALGDPEMLKGTHEIEAIMNAYRDRFKGDMHLGGSPAMGSYTSHAIQTDFGVLTGVSVMMVIIVLSLLFKRASGVVIPIVAMALGISSCIASMAVFNYPVQITTAILPSFLLAICVGASVHLLTAFYRSYDGGESKEEALLSSIAHTGTAIFYTSITTAAGVVTFSLSDIKPIASLGLFAAIGSLLAFFVTVILIPVMIRISPIQRKTRLEYTGFKPGSIMARFTNICIYISTKHAKLVVVIAVSIVLACMSIVPNIRFSQDSLAWYEDDVPIKVATHVLEEKITGTSPAEIVIDTGIDQGVLDPEFLHSIDSWLSSIEGQSFNNLKIRSIDSLLNLLKETHQALNGDDPNMYVVPKQRDLIAQELLMIEMGDADDLFLYTDPGFSKLRITLMTPWADAIEFGSFSDELKASYAEHLDTERYPMRLTGVIPIFSALFAAMVQSAAQSYALAALAITAMMIFLLRSFSDGLISMIPNLLPIMLVLSAMTLIDLPLDVFTVLIGSVALGLSVDDTVHFMHGFKTRYRQTQDAEEAIAYTLHHTGKALVITTIVLFWGFMIFTLSTLKNLDNFGILTASCIVLALLADFIIAPALMMVKYGRKK